MGIYAQLLAPIHEVVINEQFIVARLLSKAERSLYDRLFVSIMIFGQSDYAVFSFNDLFLSLNQEQILFKNPFPDISQVTEIKFFFSIGGGREAEKKFYFES